MAQDIGAITTVKVPRLAYTTGYPLLHISLFLPRDKMMRSTKQVMILAMGLLSLSAQMSATDSSAVKMSAETSCVQGNTACFNPTQTTMFQARVTSDKVSQSPQ